MKGWKQTVFAAVVAGWGAAVAADPGDLRHERDLCYLERHFQPTEAPVVLEYTVGYRFMNVEFARLGSLMLRSTLGQWTWNGETNAVPSVFVDLRFDSKDGTEPGQRGRVSIHDRIVAVVSVPDMNALLFAKDTDEYLNPLIGRTKVLRSVSCYDVQSGTLDFWHYDLRSGTVATNISDPQAIVELSRTVRPILDFLVAQSHGDGGEALSPENLRISVNASGHVVPLRLRTVKDRSPPCLGRERLSALRVDAVSMQKTDQRIYRFRSWAVPFPELADYLHDDALRGVARDAFVQTVVPVTAEYELALGAIRMTLQSARPGTL